MTSTDLTLTMDATVLFVHSRDGNLMQIAKDRKSWRPRRQPFIPMANANNLDESIEYDRGNSYRWEFTPDGAIKQLIVRNDVENL